MQPVATVARMAVSLKDTEMNTPLRIWEIIGGDTMEIKCPYCGSEEYEVYDKCGDGTMYPVDLCVCLDCDKQFSILYTVYRIKKES